MLPRSRLAARRDARFPADPDRRCGTGPGAAQATTVRYHAAERRMERDDQAQDAPVRHAVAACRRARPIPRPARARRRSTRSASFVFPDSRPRRGAVQHGARRPRLFAHLQSDVRRARGAHRRARRRRRRDRHGERPGGAASRDRHAAWARARTSSRRARSTAARTTCSTTRCRASASRRRSSIRATSTPGARRSGPTTRLLFGETLGNPGLDVLDIPRVAALAHEHGLPLLVDSTFTTPYLMQPFDARRRSRLSTRRPSSCPATAS